MPLDVVVVVVVLMSRARDASVEQARFSPSAIIRIQESSAASTDTLQSLLFSSKHPTVIPCDLQADCAHAITNLPFGRARQAASL